MLRSASYATSAPASFKFPNASAIFDSGCSTTTFNHKGFFDKVEIIDRQIQTADSTISVTHAGPVPPFFEAFYIPGLHTNLISMSDLDDLGVSMHIENGKLTCIYNGKAIFEVDKKNSLWKARADKMLECLQRSIGTQASDNWSRARQAGSTVQSFNSDVSLLVNSSAAIEAFLSLWHKRLFHRNIADLCKAIIQSRIIVGDVSQLKLQYRSQMTENVCDSCAKSKSHAFPKPAASKQGQLPRPRRQQRVVTVPQSSDRAIAISGFDESIEHPGGFKAGVVSTDLTGPYSVRTLKGNYVGNQVFLEIDSKYAYIYFYRNKSDAIKNLKSLVDFDLKKQRMRLSSYHSDGARELCGVEVQKYLASIGAQSTWISADVPQENGFSERHFRTECEQSQASMLYARYLPKSLWNFAKSAFTHVYNRFPTETSKGWMSPYEHKKGKAPDVSHLRIWGSKCYADIALSHRRKDFAPRAQVGYLVGYSEIQRDAYQIWVPETNRIVVSRSVVFDEAIPQGDVDFAKDPYWREVRQFAKRVVAKKRDEGDFYYLVDLIFFDPDIDSECLVKEIRIQNKYIVAVYVCLKDGIETGKSSSMHVADVEKLLGIHMSEDYEVEEENAGSARALTILSSLSHSINQAQIVSVQQDLDMPMRSQSSAEKSHVEERNALSQETSPTAAGGYLGFAERGVSTSSRDELKGRLILTQAFRTDSPYGSETPRVGADSTISLVVEVPHFKGALYTFANDYVARKDPVTVKEAMSGSLANRWKQAIATEISNIKDRGVVEEVVAPSDLRNIIGCKFVFKTKMKHGELDKYKARLVARGFTQVEELDYNETFAPVARMNTLRIYLKKSVDLGHFRVTIDFVAAFLNSDLSEELYMEAPDGWLVKPGHVLRLRKAIYGLKQAGRNWYQLLCDYLVGKEGFVKCLSEHCVFTKENGRIMMIVYVDDAIISSLVEAEATDLVARIQQYFELGEIGPLSWYLGSAIEDSGSSVRMSQKDYIEKMLKRYNYEQLGVQETPMIEKYAIVRSPEDELFTEFDMKSKIGSLMFAAVCTRPDIAFAVSYLARFTNHPSQLVCQAIVRVFAYLKGTKSMAITFVREDGVPPTVYCDSDYAGDVNDCKSTSGILVMIGSSPVSWYSSKQTLTAQSTTDAEIVGMNQAAKEIVWLRNLFREMHLELFQPTKLKCDNTSSMKLAFNPVFHKRTKHIMVKFQYLVEQLEANEITLEYVKSALNLADFFTKSLTIKVFRNLRDLIGLKV
jgi:hypothetical protein